MGTFPLPGAKPGVFGVLGTASFACFLITSGSTNLFPFPLGMLIPSPILSVERERSFGFDGAMGEGVDVAENSPLDGGP